MLLGQAVAIALQAMQRERDRLRVEGRQLEMLGAYRSQQGLKKIQRELELLKEASRLLRDVGNLGPEEEIGEL